jgi:hypothetical protein
MSSPIRSICGSLRKQVDVNGNTINITSSEWIVGQPYITRFSSSVRNGGDTPRTLPVELSGEF